MTGGIFASSKCCHTGVLASQFTRNSVVEQLVQLTTKETWKLRLLMRVTLQLPVVSTHDDVIKWKHFPRYWSFVRGVHRSPVNSPHKGEWRGALMFSLICAWINGWVNTREAGDLRRYRAHYYVIVMSQRDSDVIWVSMPWRNREPVKRFHLKFSPWHKTPRGFFNEHGLTLIFLIERVRNRLQAVARSMEPLLLTWVNCNPSMDK